ncbi:FAD-binding oxidoreductase [Paracoccus sp. Z330]|uniref:FAD-binding oxidoreductase n=1 Tax=Paracoccus onchidii TaxID=3017813 RepID=A0ABT4ZD08_9RHOB|nr:FAD-binding oxidoreductase [Paracoccus onchidii]MDB6177247.1 FAD-binding oxidoreductase [Paracoccus onchidii]
MASVTIIGAGIFGLTCAWEIARRGHKVRVFEAQGIGAGSSGGHVGALAPHVPDNWNPKKAFQLESLLAADSFWTEIEHRSGIATGFGRTGRLQPLPDKTSADRMQDRIRAASARWPATMPMQVTDDPETPLAPISPSGLWLRDGLTARIAPRAALRALAGAITKAGGEIVENTPMQPGQTSGPTLWATGAGGLADLGHHLNRQVGKGIKGQSALIRFSAPSAPQVFADSLHIVPHADGTTAIGSTSENDFEHDAPDALLDGIIARAHAICPQLQGCQVIDRWAGLRPRAKSRAPLLGHWPGKANHFVANGGFKIGFGMAPGIATVMADLILEGHDAIPDPFRLI